MNSQELWSKFQSLKECVKREPEATAERVSELESIWKRLYDAACDESDDDTSNLTDEQYTEICHFHHDHITRLINW